MVSRLRSLFMQFFGVARSEANGLLLLIFISMISVSLFWIYNYYQSSISKVQDNYYNYSVVELERKWQQQISTIKESQKPNWKKFNTSTKNPLKEIQINNKRKKSFIPKYQPMIFNLNLADTLILKKVYGIGSKLSKRIVGYRELLGGFVNTHQLKEVWGLHDSVIKALDTLSFIDSGYQPKMININQLGITELSKHPYISYQQANLIVNYRYQHGNFNNATDMLKMIMFDTLMVNKLKPYLKFD